VSRMSANQFGASQRLSKPSLRERLSAMKSTLVALVSLLVLAATIWGSTRLYDHLNVPVAVIAVESPLHQLTTLEVENLVAPSIRGGFLGMDLQRIRRALENHPWVEAASVRRQWPNRLRIQIVEETPIARWGDSGFLNRQGQALFADRVGGLEDLPLLAGPAGSARAVMQQYRDVNQLLQPVGLRVVEFRQGHRGDWTLRFDNGTGMTIGRDRVLEKLQRFLVVWEQTLADRAGEIDLVDIRYENGVAVHWRGDQETGIL